MEKSVLTIIIDLEFNVMNLYKLISSKDMIIFNLNLEVAIYENLLIEKNEFVSVIIATSKLEKTLSSFVY